MRVHLVGLAVLGVLSGWSIGAAKEEPLKKLEYKFKLVKAEDARMAIDQYRNILHQRGRTDVDIPNNRVVILGDSADLNLLSSLMPEIDRDYPYKGDRQTARVMQITQVITDTVRQRGLQPGASQPSGGSSTPSSTPTSSMPAPAVVSAPVAAATQPGGKPVPGGAAAAVPGGKPAAPIVAKSYKSYTYKGDQARDPFLPLTGGGANAANDQPPQVTGLSLLGLISDSRGKIALLTGGGRSFILRGGRLYDGNNKMQKALSGIVKNESVVMTGPEGRPVEIFLKKKVSP